MSKPFQINIANPAEKFSADKTFALCSVCRTIVVKTTLTYVCDSGHILCRSCQKNCDTTTEDSNEGGDCTTEKELTLNNDKKDLKTNDSNTTTQDLASGDHDGPLSTVQFSDSVQIKEKKDSKEEDITTNNKKEQDLEVKPCYTETTIEYKNINYRESKTSVESELESTENTEYKENTDSNEDDAQKCKILPRPVVCPVTNCAKMVIIDSIMLHFHFDHSKVPRIILDDAVPEEVFLKPTNFSTEVQCVATFLTQVERSSSNSLPKKLDSISSLRNTYKENKLLLLMAVRLPTSPVKLPSLKCDASRVFTRTIHTQTEKINENYSEISTICLSKASSEYQSCSSKSMCEDDEVLLLWLCKLDDEERIYSITLLGEDKRRGYCYIGDATHIRDKQDPASLYDKSECLIVKGSAINTLYDKKNQITAIVSIIG